MTIPVSRRLDFAEIPVIDLSEISASRQNVSTVDAIRMACAEVGFLRPRTGLSTAMAVIATRSRFS